MEATAITKSLDDYFTDWEAEAFGFGYGSGEQHTLGALIDFMRALKDDGRSYDYAHIEGALSARVAWLMINVLCRQDIIEYGTSPRYGWLTRHGEKLRTFVLSRSLDELYEITAGRDSDYIPCSRDSCNCGPHGYQEGVKCANPFWGR